MIYIIFLVNLIKIEKKNRVVTKFIYVFFSLAPYSLSPLFSLKQLTSRQNACTTCLAQLYNFSFSHFAKSKLQISLHFLIWSIIIYVFLSALLVKQLSIPLENTQNFRCAIRETAF